MKNNSQGATQLRKAMAEHGFNQSDLATEIGASQPTVSHWLRGIFAPGIRHRLALHRAFGIDLEAWDHAA